MGKHFNAIAITLVLVCSYVLACNNSKQDEPAYATATLTGTRPDTAVSGMAQFSADGDKVKLKLQLTIPSMANQVVAVHIHENGNCGEIGQAAGGHWNPTNKMHGKWGSSSFHSGDIGNLNLDGSGNGNLELETDMWSIGGEPEKDILSRSIVVHNGMDDFVSQPSGNSGERIGCGIITKTDQ